MDIQQEQYDSLSSLNDSDLKKLILLANEPIDENTMSLGEFTNIMELWRINGINRE